MHYPESFELFFMDGLLIFDFQLFIYSNLYFLVSHSAGRMYGGINSLKIKYRSREHNVTKNDNVCLRLSGAGSLHSALQYLSQQNSAANRNEGTYDTPSAGRQQPASIGIPRLLHL